MHLGEAVRSEAIPAQALIVLDFPEQIVQRGLDCKINRPSVVVIPRSFPEADKLGEETLTRPFRQRRIDAGDVDTIEIR